ncbi:adenylosuccinate synthetase [Halobacteria archaeon HArc-gm2]|nr:adenylosuccinate synthetase [Halobacteria archaeon HArc-gm2]
MSIAVVVGGQFGSEGKGKVTAHLTRNRNYDVTVRCGGPNSGHTVTIDGDQYVLQQIPAGVVDPGTQLYLAAGCLINLDILLEEIEHFDLDSNRLLIDDNAVIIQDEYIEEEKERKLRERISSTCSGTGVAVAKRSLRSDDVQLASEVADLDPYTGDVAKQVQQAHDSGQDVVIEGTQGFGLSVYHSSNYPYTTSRDTTAASFVGEVGISPLEVSKVIMVLRTFPIRVPGNSGPLPNEIDWETIQHESGYPHLIEERTSVTERIRRVGRFDLDIVEQAVQANSPSEIALMGTDFLDYDNLDAESFPGLTSEAQDFIANLETNLDTPVSMAGTGPFDEDLIDRGE